MFTFPKPVSKIHLKQNTNQIDKLVGFIGSIDAVYTVPNSVNNDFIFLATKMNDVQICLQSHRLWSLNRLKVQRHDLGQNHGK
jgi:hypothetical protein